MEVIPKQPLPGQPESERGVTMATPVPAPRAALDDELVPGTMLGEYQIERKLAAGGMGTVFAAVHPLIGKRAAIKILSRELCTDPASVARFVDEARVVNQIGHPNIVDVFAFGAMPDGRQYLVMELLQGETLGARLARGPLALAETCALLKQLARALDAAHAHGVTHRDLKPDNVFLVAVRGAPPIVKLLDFGIAKLSYQDTRVARTAVGAVVGTPQYIAPEQAKGHPVDARTDIYAFGGILFELLTGRPVFLADNATEVIAKHLMEPAPRPSQLAPVAPELDDLVVAMLAKDPPERPSLARICEVLERAAEPRRPSALGPVPTAVIRQAMAPTIALDRGPLRRRRGALIALAAALALGALAFAVVLGVRRRHADGAEAPTVVMASVPPAAAPAAQQPLVETAVQPAAPAAKPPDPAMKPSEPAAKPPEPAAQQPEPVTKPAPIAKAPEPIAKPAEPVAPQPESVAPQPESVAVREPVTTPPPRAQPERHVERPRPKPTGRLQLAVRGAARYTVVVDSVPAGELRELALSPGAHVIEVRADGEIARRFAVQIEAGKTEHREVAWAAATPPPDDGRALMKPGQAIPKVKR